jgi:hypothetical protein
MRINETALIPQGGMGIRVGYRNRFRRVDWPKCSCGEYARVSRSADGATEHYCTERLYGPHGKASYRKLETAKLLAKLGLL